VTRLTVVSQLAFGPFFRDKAFFVGIVGHQGFPVSVSDLESIPPLPGVSSTTRTKVVSESAYYAPWLTGGFL
jgi:hypothetical protein